jgi:hypothetical protein
MTEEPHPAGIARQVDARAATRAGSRFALHEDLRAVLASGAPPAELLRQAEASGQLVSFTHYARLLMARTPLAPSDAVYIVTE